MASRLVVPFNFEPVNSSLKTANYTLPSGVYGRVTPAYGTYVVSGLSVTNANGSKTYTESEMSLSINSSAVYFYDLKGSGTVGRTSAGSATYTVTIPQNIFKNAQTVLVVTSVTPSPSINCRISADGIATASLAAGTSPGLVFWEGYMNQIISTASTTSTVPSGNFSYSFNINFSNEKSSFWVEAGSVISCPANCAYYLEEYNKIS